jgi:rubredoxin
MITNEQKHGHCPSCKSNWDDGLIFDNFRKSKRYHEIPDEEIRKMVKESYGDPNAHFSRLVGIEDPNVYDGILFWQCPDCESKFQRFEETSPLGRRAKLFGVKTYEEVKENTRCKVCGFKGKGPCACEED